MSIDFQTVLLFFSMETCHIVRTNHPHNRRRRTVKHLKAVEKNLQKMFRCRKTHGEHFFTYVGIHSHLDKYRDQLYNIDFHLVQQDIEHC